MFGSHGKASACLWAAFVCCPLLGCGGAYETAEVRGRVTCQGKPAAGGVVEFRPVDAPEQTGRPKGNPGSPSTGTVGEDGSFTLTIAGANAGEGAVVGRHRVTFTMPPRQRPRLTGDDRSVMSREEIKEWEEKLSRIVIHPPLPCGPNITPGEVEVMRGDNQFEFALQAK